ncbi:MAG: ATP-binding cassette domain-containing protein [Sulfurospirillum sp.]|nr:ATP-binding cassette domain-containing protein [Sulfurospirillum sp.]
MQEPSVLEIEHLSFAYKNSPLLFSDLCLHVRRGEVVSILGPSGSGKSTIFELINQNLKPKTGNIKRAKLAQIFQDPYTSFHPTYTILNQINDVCNIKNYKELCKSLEIAPSLLEKKPHELSGGQLQRCSILRALLMQPKLILADEPTSALDNLTQFEVMKLLIKFLDRAGILLITHDEDLASWCSDRVVRL